MNQNKSERSSSADRSENDLSGRISDITGRSEVCDVE